MKTRLLALLVVAVITGCQSVQQTDSKSEAIPPKALAVLVGKSRGDVMANLGQPTREIESKGSTYWEYLRPGQFVVVQFSRKDLEHVNQVNAGRTQEEAYSPWMQMGEDN